MDQPGLLVLPGLAVKPELQDRLVSVDSPALAD